ncbi:MAG: MBL fold metallo-hydrolase [Chloroflexota bacterium]|nr:MBL fold metallo-hydrolase [Chloroflexota bacterium]
MAEPQFEQVHDRIYRLGSPFAGGGLTNVYVVRGERTAVVDSGVLGTPTNHLAPALQSIGLSLTDVDLVLNTHGHMDHLGGNSELKDAGADINLHRDDAPRAHSNQLHAEQAREALKVLGLEDLAPEREAFLLRLLGREVGVDRVLEDGDTVDLGQDVRLRVVHTPGHTPGSVCYWYEAAGLLITGDSVQARGSRAGGMSVLEQPGRYPSSLAKAEGTGAQALLMGHAFKEPTGDLGPVARGPRVVEVFRESAEVHEAWERAVREARTANPGASGGEIAKRAVESLRAQYELIDEPSNGYPASGIMTLPAYLRLVQA